LVATEVRRCRRCAAGDQSTPCGHKLLPHHRQLASVGRRLIARPGHRPGRHRLLTAD